VYGPEIEQKLARVGSFCQVFSENSLQYCQQEQLLLCSRQEEHMAPKKDMRKPGILHSTSKAGFGMAGIVVILAMTGAIIWKTYDGVHTKQNNSADKTTSDPSPNNEKFTANPNGATTYLTIKELGIKIKLSTDIKDTTYGIKSLSDGSLVAYFSTQSLASQDPACDAKFGPLGSIEKTAVDTDRTGAKKVVDNVSTFKVGDNYFSYSAPQALCSEKVRGVEGTQRTAFIEALKSLQSDQ
jgi:hypothetical protein